MLSKEILEVMATNKATKESLKNIELTPELLLQAREMTTKNLGNIPSPKTIHIEKTKVNGLDGEFYHYTGNRADSKNNKIVLFIHGGGFATGSVASRRYLVTTMLHNAELDGYSVEYSQYPEAQHPEALLECVKVYQGLLDQGYLSENIYLYGESAGAMLCLSVSHYLRDNGIPMPGKICVYAPAVNIQDNYDSRHLRDHRDPVIISNVNEQLSGYFPERFDRTDPYISAIYGDFDKFPPIRINVGSEEVLFDDSVELYTKCKEAGVNVELKIWENLFHVFTMFPTPESEKALKEDADFFNK